MNKVIRDFISDEQRDFQMRVGKLLASSLSGFIAGAVFASIIWGVAIWLTSLVLD